MTPIYTATSTCAWDAGFVSKCWRWCSIRWFFWKKALPHSQTWVRSVQPPFGWRRWCCSKPCLDAKPLPQLVQKWLFGFCWGVIGIAETIACCCWWWCCCCWCCCCWCCTCCWCWFVCGDCTRLACWITWPDDIICTGTGDWVTTEWLDVSTVPCWMFDGVKKWPGNAAVKAHRSVIRLLSPVCKRKWRARASRLLKACPHSLFGTKENKQKKIWNQKNKLLCDSVFFSYVRRVCFVCVMYVYDYVFMFICLLRPFYS